MHQGRVTDEERAEERAWRRRLRENRAALAIALQAERPDDPIGRLLSAPIDPVADTEIALLHGQHVAMRLQLTPRRERLTSAVAR